jgi:hypothetical protein
MLKSAAAPIANQAAFINILATVCWRLAVAD